MVRAFALELADSGFESRREQGSFYIKFSFEMLLLAWMTCFCNTIGIVKLVNTSTRKPEMTTHSKRATRNDLRFILKWGLTACVLPSEYRWDLQQENYHVWDSEYTKDWSGRGWSQHVFVNKASPYLSASLCRCCDVWRIWRFKSGNTYFLVRFGVKTNILVRNTMLKRRKICHCYSDYM